jgi:hypothetical protein
MATQWTPEHMRSVFESVKNWGRWGEDDEAGAQGLIQTNRRPNQSTRCPFTASAASC